MFGIKCVAIFDNVSSDIKIPHDYFSELNFDTEDNAKTWVKQYIKRQLRNGFQFNEDDFLINKK
jgi:hypothetical protein|tara:strand:+ start:319 stop:510 length:192 start_codon:yes stop_codon:yes gene_type:complete